MSDPMYRRIAEDLRQPTESGEPERGSRRPAELAFGGGEGVWYASAMAAMRRAPTSTAPRVEIHQGLGQGSEIRRAVRWTPAISGRSHA